jgi:hypothetical protein
MPIRMTKPSEGSNFSVAIEDRFDPSEDHIVELMSMDEYNGVSTIDGKPYTSLMWHCRIYDDEGVAFLNEIDHSPYDFVEFSSMSLAKGTKTAKAREWAGAFLGHELSEAECEQIAENFDGALVSKRALASWKLEDDKKNGGKKMRFALLRPVPARLRKAAAPAERPLASRSAAPEPGTAPNGSAKLQAVPAASETPAERRARLQAELSAMDAEDEAAADDDVPF